MRMHTGGYIYSKTTENLQMKSEACQMASSGAQRNFLEWEELPIRQHSPEP